MKVLLMAPVAKRDPASGDVTYTDSLLREPPPGVQYTSYPEALASGDLVVRGRRPKHGWMAPSDGLLLATRGLESVLRGRVMFREPFWFVSLRPGAFDLVHQHLFTVRQVGRSVPAVSSAGYPLSVLYQARDGWTESRALRAEALDRLYSRVARAHTPGLWGPAGDVLTVYTEHFRRHLQSVPSGGAALRLCGQGLPGEPLAAAGSRHRTIGFVGHDFKLKGGRVAVDAFRLLRGAQPDLEMIVVTRPSSLDGRPLPDGVTLIADAPRSTVLDDILPRLDVLLLPTAADCGAPYVVLEALQRGIPVVTSRSPWLDERLLPPAVHRVPRSPGAVAGSVSTLFEPGMLPLAREAARRLWQSEFSMPAMHEHLLRAYREALAPGAAP